MPVLLLDNVPDDLYQRLEQMAAAEQVPVTEETVRLLRRAVGLGQPLPRADVSRLLQQMRSAAIRPLPGTSDGVELLREDRNR
jgi:hypothetical protein